MTSRTPESRLRKHELPERTRRVVGLPVVAAGVALALTLVGWRLVVRGEIDPVRPARAGVGR